MIQVIQTFNTRMTIFLNNSVTKLLVSMKGQDLRNYTIRTLVRRQNLLLGNKIQTAEMN